MKTRLYLLCLVWLTALGLTAQEPAGTNTLVKLESMDKVRFRVEEDPSTGSTVLAVNPLGQVTVPVSMGFEDPVVTIPAKGLTVDELKESIRKQLEGKYYKKATIKLTLVDKTQKVGQALFIGECRGVMPLPPNEEVLLSTALIKLGYSEFANLKKVQLFREDKATGKKQDAIIFDMEAVIKKGDRSKDKDIVLQDGDRINVPEKKLMF
jgi:protein involved in polysaccharide export with SLBB domain